MSRAKLNLLLAVIALQLAACSGSQGVETGATTVTAHSLIHDFQEQTVVPGQEVTGLCRSWTLNNANDIWVNSVELSQDEGSHHSNFVFVPDDKLTGPDNIWACNARGYNFYDAIAVGGVLFAQSTQAADGTQQFPKGAAIRIPAHSRIISDIHLLNATDKAITGHARLTLHTLAADTVEVPLKAFHVEYDALDVAPHSDARFTAHCAIAADYKRVTGTTFAPKLYYLLPHTHTLATRFFVSVLGGAQDGESLLDMGPYDGESHGRTFDPPIDLAGADGLEFGCQYSNPHDRDVIWGAGTNEMCELFGFADTTSFFQSRVNKGVVDGMDGDVVTNSGSCDNDVYAK